MRRFSGVFSLFLLAPMVLAGTPRDFTHFAQPFLEKYCLECHDAETAKGKIVLEDLGGVNVRNAELWKSSWEQVALKEMPPKKKKIQPTGLERVEFSTWVTTQLAVAMKDQGGFTAHLHPAKGNHLDHDLLFGELPNDLEPTSTPARIWRIHPQEHLVRLSDLINVEPEPNPNQPGLRARGDHIPWNSQGEVKVYYGQDRILSWQGGTAAYAAAITGFPAMLATAGGHGLRNYPILYSVNAAEATQIAANAEDIIRFMAHGPIAEPWQFVERGKKGSLPDKYKGVDIRGTTQSIFWDQESKRPLTPVYELMKEEGVDETKLKAAVDFLFERLTFRPPTEKESANYLRIVKQSIADLGKEDGLILGLSPIFLDRDALFRPELARYGTPDKHGRVLLQDWELALAINAAFSYIVPDGELKQAVLGGKMKSREDAKREVERILANPMIRKPRVLQFFREFFDYDIAGSICKDDKALSQAGGDAKKYNQTMFGMTMQTDRLIELIVQEDRQVLRELLTTDRVVMGPDDRRYYSEHLDPVQVKALVEAEKQKQREAEAVAAAKPQLPQPDLDRALKAVTDTNGEPVAAGGYGAPKQEQKKPKKPKKKKNPQPRNIRMVALPKGRAINVRAAEIRYPVTSTKGTLTTLPKDQRMGILTHPGWLVSHSDAMDNHAILRGKWVRERLLGGAVPDVPITVDAMLPDDPGKTLRQRMQVTREDQCWRCHDKMDPLGLPFEMYNHVGMFRTTEQGEPVDTSGEIINSGDPALDGPVTDALDMIRKLADSERVQQVFVRHAFRFWMGRNETIHDAPVLQEAYAAYRDKDGSMNAMLASLLSSDAFLYRKVER